MKRIVISIAVLVAFIFGFASGCCSHKQCVKDNQAEKSKIEAKKAMDEMDKEKARENNQ